jgi:uncharacterized protein (TIGR02145 family)
MHGVYKLKPKRAVAVIAAVSIAICCLIAVMILQISRANNSFIDNRDGKTYRTVKIGEQIWMAENLNYKTDSSWCYDNADSNCAKYGRLYSWDAAMKACPSGWHLPDAEEWEELEDFVGGSKAAGAKLKSELPNWDGTDDYGFSALPGGSRDSDGSFDGLGSIGSWWMSAVHNHLYAGGAHMDTDYASLGSNDDYMPRGFSVRCVRDLISR